MERLAPPAPLTASQASRPMEPNRLFWDGRVAPNSNAEPLSKDGLKVKKEPVD